MLDYYFIYRLVRALSTPFNKWDAFGAGVIDDKGEIIVPASRRSPRQNDAFTKLDLVALRLRKAFIKSNVPINPLLTTTAALMLLREGSDMGEDDIEYVTEAIAFTLSEEGEGGGGEGAPTTNTGNIDGYQNARGITPAMKFKRKPKREENPFPK